MTKLFPLVLLAFLMGTALPSSAQVTPKQVSLDVRILEAGTPARDLGVDFSLSPVGGEVSGAGVSPESASHVFTPAGTTGTDGWLKFQYNPTGTPQDLTLRVTDPAGKVNTQTVRLPADEGMGTVCMDTQGGIVNLSQGYGALLSEALKPTVIGANSEVGSGARVKEKARQTIGGGGFGALGQRRMGGGIGGFGGGGNFGMSQNTEVGSDNDRLFTVEDPIGAEYRRTFTHPDFPDTAINVGGMMGPEGLLVSTRVASSPDDATFQSIYLMDRMGRKAGPTVFFVYELYQDWTLTVSWTYDRWVNGQHVEHREGGWSDSGTDFLGTFTVPVGLEGIWKRMGFSNAVRGIRTIGAQFPVAEPLLHGDDPLSLVVNLSRPSADPVTTVPFLMPMFRGKWENHNTAPMVMCTPQIVK